MGITHFDDAPSNEFEVGHLRGRWTMLGEAAGSVAVGVRRIQVPAGAWSTPAHEHGSEEEIFWVLEGRGVTWQRERTADIAAGDCIVYHAGGGAHSLHAIEPLDVLAFGPRHRVPGVSFPRLGMSLVGRRAVESAHGVLEGAPVQFVREAQAGPPEIPDESGPRPTTIVNVGAVPGREVARQRVAGLRRDLGVAAGSRTTGIKHIEVAPRKDSSPQHCHSLEEELFVVLEGDGALMLGDEPTPVRAGHVVARPAGTGVAHMFRAGDDGLTLLAYGTREPGDLCYYPRSNKISFRGLGVIARVEPLGYWDGED
jgi:uncharacterized cupin superfamily protein